MQHWDPKQYEKFEAERNQPFYDLLQLIHPLRHPRILDLGCGNGALTTFLHHQMHACFTLGIDTSLEMLAKALPHQTSTLRFEETDIQTFSTEEPFDLILSNAALQWIPNHRELFVKLASLLAPEGQFAVQMPANHYFPTHTLAEELAQEEPFRKAFTDQTLPFRHLLAMEEYAQLFETIGFVSQNIRMQLYAHYLESTASVVEWVEGSLLTYYRSRLGDLYPQFLNEYKKRLLERLGWAEPFFFPMKRLFLWGQMP